jgi:hypothetical protein
MRVGEGSLEYKLTRVNNLHFSLQGRIAANLVAVQYHSYLVALFIIDRMLRYQL